MQIKRHTIEAQLNSGIYNFVGRGVRKCDRYETFIIIIIIIIIIIVIIVIIIQQNFIHRFKKNRLFTDSRI